MRTVKLLQTPFSLGCIGDCHHGVRVGMIDKFEGDDGVQDRLYGGVWRSFVFERLSLARHHFCIAEMLQLCHLLQHLQTNRRKACFFYRVQVPAAAFDIKIVSCLERCVPAAVQYQVHILTQKPGGVDPHLKVSRVLFCLCLVKSRLHTVISSSIWEMVA